MAVLSADEIWVCAVAERVSSSISIIGSLMMFTCYVSMKRFRTLLSNRLLIYASVANLACNAATLIGGSGLFDVNSSVCEAQAFLLEWFMQTDPMFGTCMAFDVYLVMFRRWTYGQVEKVFKWYIPVCYGLPLIPALTCLVYRGKNDDKIYGSAGIWCWIDNEYAYVRIYAYYGPVWIYLMVTFAIYIRVGMEIFHKRSALRAFSSGGQTHTSLISRSCSQIGSRNRSRNSVVTLAAPLPAFTGTRTTEVEVTSTHNNHNIPATTHLRPLQIQEGGNFVNITAKEREPRRSLLDIPRDWYDALLRSFNHLDKVTIAYCKCAGLFALSILITWVPSSANRVYGLNRINSPSFGLNFAAAAVLPLQGFWNTTIFFWTSWSLVKAEYREHCRLKTIEEKRSNYSASQIQMAERGQRGFNTRGGDSESTKEVLEDEEEITTISDDARNNSDSSERGTYPGG